MRSLLTVILIIFLLVGDNLYGYYNLGPTTPIENKSLTFGLNTCKNISETDIPTIFIPGILASWYSEEGFDEAKVKRWIPDPITHVYDTLFYTFKTNGYTIEDVFYKDEFNVYIEGNPKHSLYAFGYDWKKDNKITATLLNQLIKKIRHEYLKYNKCDIGKVNIIAHSMGGLVARSMLEDMCIDEKYMSENSYYSGVASGKIRNYDSVACKDSIKVDKFITISTPHRGSPSAFPIWEKGDIERTDGFVKGKVLKSQLESVYDVGLYEVIHGYENSIPNGIITLGQLLPDIKNNNEYNDKLKYLSKSDIKSTYNIDNRNYPQNSFLEELNNKENIDKMWDKINTKYTSYYSRQTGNYEKNNILGFTLKGDDYKHINGDVYVKLNLSPNDITETLEGKDIYNKYIYNINSKEYRISGTLRNQGGFGGDGTVPTYNLLLVPNNSLDGKQVVNDKFESVQVNCYKDNLESIFEEETVDKNSSPLYKNIGTRSDFEVCSHTNMPIATAIKIYDNISDGELIPNFSDQIDIAKFSRKKLLEYIGQANYYSKYIKGFVGETVAGGISNYKKINNLFNKSKKEYDFLYKTNYELTDNTLLDEYSRIDRNILNGEALKVDLDFAGAFGKFDRVLAYDVRSPINLLITDSQGRRIGIDPETGMIINEIPGAWTSGDTEGSNEPEFFLIPVSGTGAVSHEIKTYGTGDGEYHIVLNETYVGEKTNSGSTNETKKMIIAGNAKKAFGEDYEVSISENGEKTFSNLTESILPTIELENTNIITDKQNYTLIYNIRGDSKKVGKMLYKIEDLTNNRTSISQDIYINGIIGLDLLNTGKYKLILELLDNNGMSLQNSESKKEIIIEKIDKIETINDKINSGITNNNVFPGEDKNFSNLLDEDLLGVLNFYNNKNNYFDAGLGFAINHSFNARFMLYNSTKDIKVLLPNGKTNTFELQTDFSYKKLIDNDLVLKENLNDFEIIDNDTKYYFSKKYFRLSSVFKNNTLYDVIYDNQNRVYSIKIGDREVFKFNYDLHTGNLDSLVDSYENTIDLSYDILEDTYILEKISGEDLLYNLNGEIKIIGGIYAKLFRKNPVYKEKLENIVLKLSILSSYQKKILLRKISALKQNYLKSQKNDYTKKVLSYFINEIITVLEN